MRLVRSVGIERFRSFEKATLPELEDFVVLVGPNNCGKSNVLRALNLFFNHETDPDSFLDFDSDFRLRPATSKKKKSIRIRVEFSLPDEFKLRSEVKEVETLLGRHFWIAKTWTPLADPFYADFEFSGDGEAFTSATADQAAMLARFLSLVSFRYIPNRAIPAEVTREESPALLRHLTKRLQGEAAASLDTAMDQLSKVGRKLAEPIATDLIQACVGVAGLELATPSHLLEMRGETGFKSSLGSLGKVDDRALGSGVQSLLMFHVLHLLDQGQYQQGFGWKQAFVWGIEEPESSLHRQLQVWLAMLLRRIAMGKGSRFQIIATTHNDVFVYAAECGYAAQLDSVSFATTLERKPPEDLVSWATDYGVTAWAMPAMKFPLNTVILVEGAHDRTILERAAELTGVGTGLVFRTASELDPSFQGDGWNSQKAFVDRHCTRFRHRLPARPLLVLIDWDTSDSQLNSTVTKYGADGTSNCFRMDLAAADPAVGDSFRGIERFYAAAFLNQAQAEKVVDFGTSRGGGYIIDPRALGSAKAALARRFVDKATPEDCKHLLHVLTWASARTR